MRNSTRSQPREPANPKPTAFINARLVDPASDRLQVPADEE
jgi:hypothetical protein